MSVGRSVSASVSGVWALLGPRPNFVFWGVRLWAHPAVLRADAADVAGPQLCLLPGEGEGAAICSPMMAAKCQGEGMGMGVGRRPRQEGDEGPGTPPAPSWPACPQSAFLARPLPPSWLPKPIQISLHAQSRSVPSSPPLSPHPAQCQGPAPTPRPPARSPSLILQNNLFMETEKSTNGRSAPLPRIPPPSSPTSHPSSLCSRRASTLLPLQGQ